MSHIDAPVDRTETPEVEASVSRADGHCRIAYSLPTVTGLLVALASVAVMTLAGCANSEGIVSKAVVMSPSTLGQAETPFADPSLATPAIPADWWKSFGDPVLSGLVDQALVGSPNLRIAQARLLRAQANASAIRSNDLPQVGLGVDLARQLYTTNGLYPAPLAGNIYSSGTIQAQVSWELDFFGKNAAALDAALGATRASEADIAASRVLLAANVARTYVALARLVDQRDVADRSLQQRNQQLDLIRQRVSAGLDTTVELRQGEGLLPETRQQLEAIDEQISLTRHALAALTAQAPNALDTLIPRLQPVQVVPLPAAVPVDLLGRRADITAARWRVEAATSDVKSAKAQFYPNVNLTAFVGLSSIGLDRLFRESSEQYGAGPAIRLPIFDAGRLRANLTGRTADLDAAVENYNATLIDAVRDAADQIASLQSIARQQVEQQRTQVAAEQAYDLALQRYRAGLGTFLTVLTADATVLNQRRLSTDLRARVLDTQVLLIRSLGGGYAVDPQAANVASAPQGAAVMTGDTATGVTTSPIR